MAKTTPNPIDVQIGARIRSRRLRINKTLEWLAGEIGLTYQQVQKYEKGINRVGGSRMTQIATALRVHPSYFFGDGGSVAPEADAEVRAFITSRDGLAVIAAFPKLTPALAHAFVDCIVKAAGRS